ncbi:S49 family peptidase [Orbus mooreae]|uniref:S49 family peptidase n=1 Tax=Orbus mooreae TaxID=3074107 RepID=UPI00370D3265
MKKDCNRILNAIKQTPWAITPSALESIISIASRSYSDPNIAATIQQQRETQSIIEADTPLVAVINIFGPIFTRADLFSEISGACSISSLKSQIDAALNDDGIGGIVLNIDSPGGAVTGTHELANYIRESSKPIVSYVSGMACSAAYWLASATRYIYADKTALLGSVGVVAMWTDDSEAKKKQGLTDYEIVSSQSPKKRENPTTDEGRASLQKTIDGLADVFVSDVAVNRGVSVEHVLADFGQGGVFLANEAINKKMADEVSSLDCVINNFNFTGEFEMQQKNKNASTEEIDKDKQQQQSTDDELGKDIPKKPEEGNDIESDDNSDDEPSADEDETESDKEEDAKTHQALNRFAKSNPNMYGAIMRRGIRRERDRIAGIDELDIKGHNDLIKKAKYGKPLSVAKTALEATRAEKKLRSKFNEDYAIDGNFHIDRSSTNGNSQVALEQSALDEMAKGAKAALGEK